MYKPDQQFIQRHRVVTSEMVSLINDLGTPSSVPEFSYDEKKENKKVRKLIKAAKRIHNRFCLPKEKI